MTPKIRALSNMELKPGKLIKDYETNGCHMKCVFRTLGRVLGSKKDANGER
jgi:hypothetical protein